jgi:hypothetical protein
MAVLGRLKRTVESYTPQSVTLKVPRQSLKKTPPPKRLATLENIKIKEKLLKPALEPIDRSTIKRDSAKNIMSDKSQIDLTKLMENWSLYMANMGSHFKQIAEESHFRSKYLTTSTPDPVCLLIK